MIEDYKKWYEIKSKFFNFLKEKESVTYDRLSSVLDVLDYIVFLKEDQRDKELMEIFETGFIYIFSQTNDMFYFIEKYFNNDFEVFMKYDKFINYNLYMNEVKDILIDEKKYKKVVAKEFDFVLKDSEDIISNLKEPDLKRIQDYNIQIMSVMPNDKMYLTISEIFLDIAARLPI